MFLNYEQRKKLLKGFIEVSVNNGNEVEDVGRDCALVMGSMIESENDTEKGSGDYDAERSN